MDFSVFIYLYRQEILKIISKVSGSKYLFIDETIMKRIDLIVSASSIKQQNVIKICRLGSPVQNSCNRFMYIIQSSTKSLKKVIKQIEIDKKESIDRHYTIIFVPQIHFECEELLSQNGLYGEVEIESAFIGLIPLAKDVLSLGLDDFYFSVFGENLLLSLDTVAKAINLMQRTFGQISQIHAFGQISGIVANMLESEGSPGQISHLLLLDRSLDLTTPFMTNISYGGILSEVFGMKEGIVTFPNNVPNLIPGKISMASPDKIFEEFCDLHFTKVTFELSQKVKKMASQMEGRLATTSLEELRRFVASDLGTIKEDQRLIIQHLSACEHIQREISEPGVLFSLEHSTVQDPDRSTLIEYVQDLIFREMDPNAALSLVVLLSQSTGFLWKSEVETLTRAFCHNYGFHYLAVFDRLEQGGLISVNRTGKSSLVKFVSTIVKPNCPFRTIAKRLNLLPSQKNTEGEPWKEMSDVSYLFNGCFVPMFYRLAEEFVDSVDYSRLSMLANDCNILYKSRGGSLIKPTCVMVFVVGGCTMQEIAAIRFLGRRKGVNVVVGCTCIVNKYEMLKPFLDFEE